MPVKINLNDFPYNLSYLDSSFESEVAFVSSLENRINASIPSVIPKVLLAMQQHLLNEIPTKLKNAFEAMYDQNEMLGNDPSDEDACLVIHKDVSDYYEFNNSHDQPLSDFMTYLAIKGLHTSHITIVEPPFDSRIEIKQHEGRFSIDILPSSNDDPEAKRFRLRFFVNTDMNEVDVSNSFYTESFCERVTTGGDAPKFEYRFDNLSKDDLVAWSDISKFTERNNSKDFSNIAGLVDTTNQLVAAIFEPELKHDFEEINQYIQDLWFDTPVPAHVEVEHEFSVIIPKILKTHDVSNEEYLRLTDRFVACLLKQKNHRVELDSVEPIFDELLAALCNYRIDFLKDPVKVGEFVHDIEQIKDTLNYIPPSYNSFYSNYSVEVEQFLNVKQCSDLCDLIDHSLVNSEYPSLVEEPLNIQRIDNSL